jgi:Nucleotidyl transferase AbiEii toxin, Type IV TA system
MIDGAIVRDAAGVASAHARERGDTIPPRAFEKDFWVTQCLRAIYASELGNQILFKGGTSLSKAYQLIARFSEDIDLLIDPVDESEAAMESLFDELRTAAMGALPNGSVQRDVGEPGFSRDIRIRPDFLTPKQSGLLSDIKLEAGRRGGPVPSEVMRIRPMLADELDDLDGEEFESFDVKVLHPSRTLVEKLGVVRNLGQTIHEGGEIRPTNPAGRHFYDIFQLLADDCVAMQHLHSVGDFTEILRDCEEITARYFGSAQVLDESFADVATFADDTIWSDLKPAYEYAKSTLLYNPSTAPDWDEIRERVRDNRKLLTPTP